MTVYITQCVDRHCLAVGVAVDAGAGLGAGRRLVLAVAQARLCGLGRGHILLLRGSVGRRWGSAF